MADIIHPENNALIQDIEALIDGELSPSKAGALQKHLAASPELRARFQNLMLQKALLNSWWKTRNPYKN